MHLRLLSALACTLSLAVPASASAAHAPEQDGQPLNVQPKLAQMRNVHAQDVSAQDLSRQAQAAWLSQQLDYPVQASQVLLAPEAANLEGCTIARTRRAPTGATALSLRCPTPALPHLVLLDLPRTAAMPLLAQREASSEAHSALGATTAKPPNIVRAGAALRADWHSGLIHGQLPVVALDSGAAGAEIRVRIPQTNRIVRARILSAHAVAIVVAGA